MITSGFSRRDGRFGQGGIVLGRERERGGTDLSGLRLRDGSLGATGREERGAFRLPSGLADGLFGTPSFADVVVAFHLGAVRPRLSLTDPDHMTVWHRGRDVVMLGRSYWTCAWGSRGGAASDDEREGEECAFHRRPTVRRRQWLSGRPTRRRRQNLK